jgi:hypothetical protein
LVEHLLCTQRVRSSNLLGSTTSLLLQNSIPVKPALRLRLLRALLLFSAFAWGVSIFGVVLPWPRAVEALQGLGARDIPADPMLDYWLRMGSGAFALVGGLFLLLALQPARYAVIIPWFGWLMLGEGIILLAHGVRLHLPPLPFYADTGACLFGGLGIVALANAAKGVPAVRPGAS